jgi:heterodisulfide reductase subunit C
MSDIINTSDFDADFRKDVFEEPGAEKIVLCFNCTGCTSGCPMADQEPEYNIRKFLRMANLGMKDQLLKSPYIWYCTTCYKCQERCPQGVQNVDTMLKIRTIAIKNGIMLDNHRKVSQLVIKFGHAVPINDEAKQKRKDVGLEDTPPTVHKFGDALAEVQKVIKIAGFDTLVANQEADS